jgi:hypothetical protein
MQMTIEMRTCKVCGETKEAVQGSWMMQYGKPTGRVCYACSRATRATDEGRAKDRAASKKTYEKKTSTGEGREQINAQSRKRNKNHSARKRVINAKANAQNPKQKPANRRWSAALVQATPSWLTPEMWDAMDAIYAESYLQGRNSTVDHIVPLIGEDAEKNHVVCGLNVPWNLQLLDRVANTVKRRSVPV